MIYLETGGRAMELEGKTAIVTGGSRGIGKGIALALAKAGADVAILYRMNKEEAIKVVGQIESYGQKGLAEQVDDECHDIVDRFSCQDIVDKRLINVICN